MRIFDFHCTQQRGRRSQSEYNARVLLVSRRDVRNHQNHTVICPLLLLLGRVCRWVTAPTITAARCTSPDWAHHQNCAPHNVRNGNPSPRTHTHTYREQREKVTAHPRAARVSVLLPFNWFNSTINDIGGMTEECTLIKSSLDAFSFTRAEGLSLLNTHRSWCQHPRNVRTIGVPKFCPRCSFDFPRSISKS